MEQFFLFMLGTYNMQDHFDFIYQLIEKLQEVSAQYSTYLHTFVFTASKSFSLGVPDNFSNFLVLHHLVFTRTKKSLLISSVKRSSSLALCSLFYVNNGNFPCAERGIGITFGQCQVKISYPICTLYQNFATIQSFLVYVL